MATLGGIPIADRESEFSSGAAFLLSKTSQVAEKIQIHNDAFLEVKPNVNYVIVRFNNATTPESALKQGHELAQQGLDLLSIHGKEHLAIRDTEDEHLIWWRQNDEQLLRVVVMEPLNVDTHPLKVTAFDKAGNEIKPPAVKQKYHLSFRYFRLSQITEDLYDAYRNMYLAFELLLSSKYPKKGREIDWLRNSLTAANTSLDLLTTLSKQGINTIDSIIQIIYDDARLPLFHAKEGQVFYPPQSTQYQISVKKAHNLLTKIVLRMSKLWYNAHYQDGGVHSKWLIKAITHSLSKARMLMSEDTSPFDPNQTDLSHDRYKTTNWFNTELLPNDTLIGKGPAIRGKLNISKFDNFVCRRFEVVEEEIPIYVHIMKDELILSGIDQLECQFDNRINIVRQPKNLYPR